VNNISTFHDGIERPVVSISSHSREVVELALFGPMDQFALKRLAEDIKDQLLNSPYISRIELKGTPES